MLKKGKEEIIYLLNKSIEKFEQETGKKIVQNTNRKNYESLAVALSDISNNLPNTSNTLGHSIYEPISEKDNSVYPFRKYDITGGQIRDALMGLVANPRPFLVDTCYIYVYGIGRKAFEKSPVDDNLIADQDSNSPSNSYSLIKENQQLRIELNQIKSQRKGQVEKKYKIYSRVLTVLTFLFGVLFLYTFFMKTKEQEDWAIIKSDYNILPYKVSKSEIDSLEGLWLCYIGSPQARISDPNRYHKVVTNFIDIKYKNGYFTYTRYGASFNHKGYVQFEAPGLVSIHSWILNNGSEVESPRHSLLKLQTGKPFLSAISASWNFDVGPNNRIIGIREVYQKVGKGGDIQEVINSLENASCQCKIIRWTRPDKTIQTFYLRNISLDTMQNATLKKMIDEESILLKDPEDEVLINRLKN